MSVKEKIIALIFDFDNTLISGNMQQVIFDEYEVNEEVFWNEVKELSSVYNENNYNIISNEMIYLSHFLTYVKEGVFNKLNNKKLFELGSKLNFFKGVMELFQEIRQLNQKLEKENIVINIYVVSSGFRQMILGSKIALYLKKVWACEFIDSYLLPNYKTRDKKFSDISFLSSVCYFVDHTIKTRVIFELNKGSYEKVNKRISKEQRLIHFEDMFYIADGFNDIPAFEILNNNLNHCDNTLTVYHKDDCIAKNLIEDKRVGAAAVADYTKDSKLYTWIMNKIHSRL